MLNHVYPDAELAVETRALAEKLLAKDPLSLALTKSTCRALASQMVPLEATVADPEYLLLPRALRDRSKG